LRDVIITLFTVQYITQALVVREKVYIEHTWSVCAGSSVHAALSVIAACAHRPPARRRCTGRRFSFFASHPFARPPLSSPPVEGSKRARVTWRKHSIRFAIVAQAHPIAILARLKFFFFFYLDPNAQLRSPRFRRL
jgi:hypothetical protein